MIYTFTNQKDAIRFINSQGGPIDISLEHIRRGHWEVTVTPKNSLEVITNRPIRVGGTTVEEGTPARLIDHREMMAKGYMETDYPYTLIVPGVGQRSFKVNPGRALLPNS